MAMQEQPEITGRINHREYLQRVAIARAASIIEPLLHASAQALFDADGFMRDERVLWTHGREGVDYLHLIHLGVTPDGQPHKTVVINPIGNIYEGGYTTIPATGERVLVLDNDALKKDFRTTYYGPAAFAALSFERAKIRASKQQPTAQK